MIYLKADQLAGIEALKITDYYSRREQEFVNFPFTTFQEYVELPEKAELVMSLPAAIDYAHSGIVFSNSPTLEEEYLSIFKYWNKKKENIDVGAVYYQNTDYAYMVNLEEEGGEVLEKPNEDELLSEAYVVKLEIPALTNTTGFIEFIIGLDPWMFTEDGGMEVMPVNKLVDTIEGDAQFSFYLSVEEILASPNPNLVYIDLIRYEMLDYGYYY